MTPRQIAKLKENFSEFGQVRSSQGLGIAAAKLAKTVAQWLCFRGDCFLYARSLAEPLLAHESIADLTIEEANASNLWLFASMKKASDVLWYKTLLEKGRSCVMAFKDGQLIAYGWFTPVVDPAVERTCVPLAQDEIFMFDLFTVPALRHQGIQRTLLKRMFQVAQERGYKRVLSLVMVDNEASLRLHDGLGFHVITRFTKIRFLGLVRFYFHPNLFGRAGDVVRWL